MEKEKLNFGKFKVKLKKAKHVNSLSTKLYSQPALTATIKRANIKPSKSIAALTETLPDPIGKATMHFLHAITPLLLQLQNS